MNGYAALPLPHYGAITPILAGSCPRAARQYNAIMIFGIPIRPILLQAFLCTGFVSLGILCLADDPGDFIWPGWRGADRDGVSHETGWIGDWPKGGPKILWRAFVGAGFSSFSVDRDRAYTMGHDNGSDTIWRLHLETGEKIWSVSHEAPFHEVGAEGGPTTTPTLDENLVYTLSRTGHLFCLTSDVGEVVWAKHLVRDCSVEVPLYGFAGSPLLEGDSLIVDAGVVLAFDKKNGLIQWRTEDYGAAYSSPVAVEINGNRYLAVFNNRSLVLLEAAGGGFVSSYPWETSSKINVATPIFHDNKIFISSGFGMGCALLDFSTPSLPTLLWKNNNMHTHFNSCVYWDGNLYGFDGHVTRDEGFLTCLDFEDGSVRWVERGVRKGSLVIASGRILAMEETGNLIVAEATPESYDEISRSHVLGGKCWTPPVLAGGRILCRNAAGQVVCLDVRQDASFPEPPIQR